ncbi:hypothetical protein VNO77_23691 [Canavalia gladiata]|uniref:Uncharacterized protein n=1 Tax=Canavalia gladiata TaxID=3824 RepID=A0AAN9L5P1_CANGL
MRMSSSPCYGKDELSYDIINWSSELLLKPNNQILPLDYYCAADHELLKMVRKEKLSKLTLMNKEFMEKMMLYMGQIFPIDPEMKCRGIVLRSAYKDLLAFFKLKRKDQAQAHESNEFDPQHPEHNDYFDYMSFLPLVPYEELPDPHEAAMFLSIGPSAPPIPDSTIIEGNLLANFEGHGEQVEYKGVGLIDMVYVPWLEEVCNIHPSLIECQRKRTSEYGGWAFTALGRVLHFLKTTKVAEMNEEACECLQLLWDEAQVFGFDLSWLAPQVEFALSMKGYVEKKSIVNKLEEEKRSLELIIQELSLKLIEKQKEVESFKDDLAKLWVDLGEQIDCESFLGYQLRRTSN